MLGLLPLLLPVFAPEVAFLFVSGRDSRYRLQSTGKSYQVLHNDGLLIYTSMFDELQRKLRLAIGLGKCEALFSKQNK